jgi:haloacetate dehalogenase
MPEHMVGPNLDSYIEWTLEQWTLNKTLNVFTNEALESYLNQACDPARLHALCSDDLAGATTDRRIDLEDQSNSRKISIPTRVLYGAYGFPAKNGNAAPLRRSCSSDLDISVCEPGHFVMEENPQAVLDTFLPFFAN